MNSDQVYAAIERIAAEPGKNDKEVMIREFGKDADFRKVLQAALDPFVTYGIAKIPEYDRDSREMQFGTGTWELLKQLARRTLTGNAARGAISVELTLLSDQSAELLKRIITKDLRAGFSESTVNKAVPKLIPTFPYMRCSLPKEAKLEQFPWAEGCFSQEKADGMFANVNHERGGLVTITTRQGSLFLAEGFAALHGAVRNTLHAGTQTHGELLIERAGMILPREVSNGLLNSLLQGGQLEDGDGIPIFIAWDQIPLGAVRPKGRYAEFYAKRWSALQDQVEQGRLCLRLIESRIVHSVLEAYDHYRAVLVRGKEGTVVKSPHGPWSDSTSKFQVKLKLEVDCDLAVVRFNPGEGKNATTFGSIVAATSDGLLEVGVSGFKDAARREIWQKRDSLIGRIMTVRANSIMAPTVEGGLHSLFLPRFIEFRLDKTMADNLPRVRAQFEAAVGRV